MAYNANTDYAAEIAKRKVANPNDPYIAQLESARQQKIASNPAAYGQYASGYNPQTGVQTFDDGTTAEKFTFEDDGLGNSYPTNAGTGVRLPGDPVPTPIIGGNVVNQGDNKTIAVTEDPYADMQEHVEALSMETDPDYNENLEQLSPEEMEEEIL